ncbi:hypothetical protein [Chitinimonas sp. BJYL2]|uniref:hypothetical protein n=1 Tax=Chitinimonas sp. BJYL2 TaxID=2976696 RepID=UPI0022B5AB58|nr:hypothetical protein [Chitinimonas sp. BJYL2]
MNDPQLWKQWKVTESLLVSAKRRLLEAAPHLNQEDATALAQYENFIQHNEFGLALDTLAEVGSEYPCRGSFWRDLERAAEAMQLTERATEFRQNFISTLRGNGG